MFFFLFFLFPTNQIKLQEFMDECRPVLQPDAICRYDNCLQYHTTTDIRTEEPGKQTNKQTNKQSTSYFISLLLCICSVCPPPPLVRIPWSCDPAVLRVLCHLLPCLLLAQVQGRGAADRQRQGLPPFSLHHARLRRGDQLRVHLRQQRTQKDQGSTL